MITYRTIPIRDAVILTVDGEIDAQASQDLLRSIVQDAKVAGHHLLIDLRGTARPSALAYSEVHALVLGLVEHPSAFAGRIALLTDYDRLEKAQFFEAAAGHHGFEVRAFYDAAAAVSWLKL